MIDAVTTSFQKQGFMKLLGARLVSVEPGKVIIACPWNESFTQHNGYFHGGVLTALADNACGYAALTVQPEGKDVITVEFKINFLKPAKSPGIIATGNLIHAGRTLTVCNGEVFDDTSSILLAQMTATIMAR